MKQAGFSPSAAIRNRIYVALASIFFLLAIGLGIGKAKLLHQPFNLVVSDDRYYYAYLPSVVIDGDLDFTNQISEHWGTDFRPEILANHTETGMVQNKYPIGVALTLLPGFLIGHILALISGGLISANGYSWVYQLLCLGIIQLLVWQTLKQIDWLLTQRLNVPAGPTFLSLVVIAVGTPYLYYACRNPFMVHIISTFWCTTVVTVAATKNRKPNWFWFRLAFCGAMAMVCRPTNIHLIFVATYGVVQTIRTTGFRRAITSFPLAGIAIVPISLQILTWHFLDGSWIYYSYGEEGFNWFHPVLAKTLFSSRHGLFFWSPILLIAVIGLLLRARDSLIQCWFLGGILLWYANSAWRCWWFGDAYGARAFLELSGLFGIGLALSFSYLKNKFWLSTLFSVLVIVFNLTLMALYIAHRIPRADYLIP
jgi:hypothetical protein